MYNFDTKLWTREKCSFGTFFPVIRHTLHFLFTWIMCQLSRFLAYLSVSTICVPAAIESSCFYRVSQFFGLLLLRYARRSGLFARQSVYSVGVICSVDLRFNLFFSRFFDERLNMHLYTLSSNYIAKK